MRSQVIDRGLEEDSRTLRRECKVLLLGGGKNWKGELIKSAKTVSSNSFTVELATYRPAIYKTVISCAKALIRALKQLEIHPEQDLNRAYGDFLLDYSVDPDPDMPLGTKVGEAIGSVWQDPCILKIRERSTEFCMMDSAS
jgi:guanine nucleotide-binding protein G(i) subunit alpha